MSENRKDGSDTYKSIAFNYSAYGKDKSFGGNAVITIFTSQYVLTPMITLNNTYPDIEAAESAIKSLAKEEIDKHVK
ncbi:MAG: hypothetical protein WAW86_10665 [Gammaproteobacteria bacterium]